MTTMMFGPGNNVFSNEEFDCSCESGSRNDVVNVRASMEGHWRQETGLLAKAGFAWSDFENWHKVGSRNKISAECWNLNGFLGICLSLWKNSSFSDSAFGL